VVDSYTCGYEMYCKKIKGYGVYVDIFKYNTIPNKEEEVEEYYTELQKIKHKLSKSVYNDSKYFIIRIIRKLRYFVNSKKIAKKYIKYTEKYNDKDYNNVMTNWPVYGAKNDTLCKNSFEKYKDVRFENITAMIVSDYDTILKQTFGDYLKLPPKEDQISHHHMKMYRKDLNEK
jgi:lipopolysaccharide cholinephosphotransferase